MLTSGTNLPRDSSPATAMTSHAERDKHMPSAPRRRSRVGRFAHALLAVITSLLMLSWFAGWWLTDRWVLTQYAWWGGLAILGAAIALTGTSIVVRRLFRPPPPRSRTDRLIWVMIGIGVILEAWHQFNCSSLVGPTAASRTPELSIVHCNLGVEGTSKDESQAFARRLVSTGQPDILVISIANYPVQWAALRSAMGHTPAHPVNVTEGPSGKIFSTWPVASSRAFVIPTLPEWAIDPPEWIQRAIGSGQNLAGIQRRNLERFEPTFIHAVTLDTTAKLGRPFTLYFVDYPSSPLISRAAVAAAVRQRMNQMMTPTIPGEKPVPPPDLIIGDFNTPRGSASLRTIMPGYSPATDAAGLGLLGTFPRSTPLLHIDNALVSPDWRATDYTTIDPGIGEHRAQSLRLSPAP